VNVLGLSCSFWHDPAAALVIDGDVVAAVEQERLSRRKHAPNELPVEAARFCLDAAGLRASDLDAVANPWSFDAVRANRLAYVRRALGRRPKKALSILYRGGRQASFRQGKFERALSVLGVDPRRTEAVAVEHHLAHAASGALFSGFGDCAIASIDGEGELTTCLFAELRDGRIHKRHEIQKPDSLGLFYASITDYLGFEVNDGEFRVMGMASYGDPSKADLSGIVRVDGGDLRLDTDFVWAPRHLRFEDRSFGRALVERLGPPRAGDEIDEPYVHVAAAAQRVLEEATIALIEHHLADVLRRTKRLVLVGGVGLNVALNRRLLEHPLVDALFVPPNPGDAGTALGAAALVAAGRGDRIAPLSHAYLGPGFTTKQVREELDGLRIPYAVVDDAAERAARLLAAGEVVAWFQGRAEWGPRALGDRSILGHPGVRGTADDINARIKYRERWRPFCPSVLAERAEEFLGSRHPSPFMTLSFRVPEAWRARTPEVVHVDGTVRPQVVTRAANPRYHALLGAFERRTGLPCVINTSMNRRGEPMVTSPRDALAMFYGSGLEHLFLEDVYVAKSPAAAARAAASLEVAP
jgi:carbamoyltransferase